ncbi:MAG: peptidase M14, partial [Gemmatimonadota bacterium]|nr:peptidase M14 [Gemmatimonadota bacterium]
AWEDRTVTPAEGDWLVPLDQPLGRLIFTLLEPRSDDGFADWGFLADVLSPGADYPILRVSP